MEEKNKSKTMADRIEEIRAAGKGFSNPEIGRKLEEDAQKSCEWGFKKRERMLSEALAHSHRVVIG